MTLQEIFDQAYKGLAGQGWKQSRNANDTACAYRGQNGCKCAIGHLIPDAAYSIELEGSAVHDVHVRRTLPFVVHASFRNPTITLLEHMQSIHDNSYDPSEMQALFTELADQFTLRVPALERDH